MRANAARSRPAFDESQTVLPSAEKTPPPKRRGPLVRRQEELGARREVDEKEIVVAPLHEPGEDGEAAVARDVGVGVAARARRACPWLARERVEEVGVDRRRAPRVRREEKARGVAREAREAVRLPAPFGHGSQGGAIGAGDPDLLVHSPARSDGERQERADGRPADLAHRVFERRHQLGETSGRRDRPDLRQAGEIRDEGDARPVG